MRARWLALSKVRFLYGLPMYSVTAIRLLQIMVHVKLFPMINVLYYCISTFRSMCAVPDLAVFCNSFKSSCPDVLHRYFLYDIEMVPFALIINLSR